MVAVCSVASVVRLCRLVVLGIIVAGAGAADAARPVHAECAPFARDEAAADRPASRSARRVACDRLRAGAPRVPRRTPRRVSAAPRWRDPTTRVPRAPIYLSCCALLR